MFYIYKITNLLTGENYIGQKKLNKNKNPLEDNYYGSGVKIKEDIKSLGLINFKKEIIESNILTEKEADEKEIKYISYYKSIGEATYNLAPGGHYFYKNQRLIFNNDEDYDKLLNHISNKVYNNWKNIDKESYEKRCLNMSEGWKKRTDIQKKDFSELRSKLAKEQYNNLTEEKKKIISDKKSNTLKNVWKNRTDENKKDIGNNISKSLKEYFSNKKENNEILSINGKDFKILNKLTGEIISGNSISLWIKQNFKENSFGEIKSKLFNDNLEDYKLIEIDNTKYTCGNYEYNNINFKSSYTLYLYLFFSIKKFNFEYQPNYSIDFLGDDGKNHKFYPDFKLNDNYLSFFSKSFFNENDEPYNRYTKKYWTSKYNDLIKSGLIIYREKDFNDIFDIVKKEYGKDFIKKCKKIKSNN